jgi:hypothetical protein
LMIEEKWTFTFFIGVVSLPREITFTWILFSGTRSLIQITKVFCVFNFPVVQIDLDSCRWLWY